MLYLLAWRNVWRNATRTRWIVLSTAFSIAGIGIFGAIVRGLNEQRLQERLRTSLGHGKITHTAFLSHKPADAYFLVDSLFKQKIRTLPCLQNYSTRLNVRAQAYDMAHWLPLDVYGIIPEEEKSVLELHQRIKAGKYLSGREGQEIVIGTKLADKLRKKIGDTLAVHFLQSTNNQDKTFLFKIVGIYGVPSTAYTETHIFIPYETLRKILTLPAYACHQWLFKTDNPDDIAACVTALRQALPALWVKGWIETAPDLAYLHTLTSYFLGGLALLVGLLLGVLQHILQQMVWQERAVEWKRLKAWGLTRQELWRLWALETGVTTLLGILLGGAVGSSILAYLQMYGINLAIFAAGLGKLGYSTHFFPLVLWKDWAMIATFFVLLPCLQAIYFGGIIARLKPV